MPTTDQVLKIQATLTHRDHRLLGWLYDHGLLTTPQINNALYGSLDFCQRRLLRLTSLGVLTRFRPQKPDGGSYPYHYLLDQLGVQVVAAQRRDEPPRRDTARTRRHHLTSRANLPHLLATNQFFIDLATHERVHPGTRLAAWEPPSRYQQRGGLFQAGDNPQVMLLPSLRPDGFGIWIVGQHVTPFWLEMDLATEPLSTLVDKAVRYCQVAAVTGRRYPVLYWLPTAARELHLHQRLATDLTRRDAPVATAALDHANATGLGPAEAVWWLHGHTGSRVPLHELPAESGQHRADPAA